jgi:hypothetical protein
MTAAADPKRIEEGESKRNVEDLNILYDLHFKAAAVEIVVE